MIIAVGAVHAVHAARRESFAVYAAVNTLYFFPWRLLRQRPVAEAAATPAIATTVSP